MIKLILKQMLSVIICIAVLLSLFPGTVVIAAMPEDYKLWLFNNESSLSIIETNNTSVSFDSERSAMKVSSTGTDPFVRLDYSAAALSTRAHTYVILVYEVEASNTNTSKTQVFFSTSNKVYESPDACHSFYAQKGDLCYEIIDLSAASYWTGNVHKLRLDIFQSFDRSDCMYVYAVGLAQTAGEAEAMVKRFVTPTTTSERMDYRHLIFNSDAPLSIISTYNTSVSFAPEKAALKVCSVGEDPFFYLDYTSAGISVDTHKYITLVYEIDAENTNSSKTQLFLSTTSQPYDSANACYSFYAQKGSVAYEIVDLSEASYWTGCTYKIRIDPFQHYFSDDCMYIYAVALSETADEAEAIAKSLIPASAPSVIIGDSDLDGAITAIDSLSLSRQISGLSSAESTAIFDINEDSSVNASDSLLIKKIMVGSSPIKVKNGLSYDGGSIIGNVSVGDSFSVAGTVSSGFDITSLTVEIYNASSLDTVKEKTVSPNAQSFDLASLSDEIDISSLAAGSYRFRIKAKDALGSSRLLWDNPFTVSTPSYVSIGNGSYDPISLEPSQAYSINGAITSNYNITRVTVSILSRDGSVVFQSASAAPYAKSYDITALNNSVRFGSLASGDYYFCVTVSDASGTTTRLISNLFTVLGTDALVASFQQKALAEWIKPVRAKILSVIGTGRGFGAYRTATRQHAAIDYYVSNGSGTPVYAMQSGTVIEYLSNFYYGTAAVAVQHADGSVARYCEISTSLRVGDKVTQGQHIATIIGNTLDGGTMLHLELYLGTATGSLSRTNTTYDYVTGNYNRRRDILNPEFLLGLTRES